MFMGMPAISTGRHLRVGAGLPAIRADAELPGLVSFIVFPGRYAYDMVRRRPNYGANAVGGAFPPVVFPAPTAYGFAIDAFYSFWSVGKLSGASTQAAHTLEAVVYAVGGPSGTSLPIASHGLNLGTNNAGQFYASTYDIAVRTATSSDVAVQGGFYVLHATLAQNMLRLYVNGVEKASVATTHPVEQFGNDFSISSNVGFVDRSVRIMSAAAANDVAWSPGLIQRRALAPWAVIEWPEELIFFAPRRASGTTFNDTISDALTAADSLLCAITFGADLADSWTLAESAAAAVTFEIPIADSVTPGDIFGSGFEAVVTFTTTLEDSATLAESFGAGLTLDVVFSDPVTAADSLAYTLVFSVAIADSVYPGDIGDPSVAAVSFAAAVSDSVSFGESFVGGFVYTSAFSDGWTVGDSLDDSLTLFARAAFTMLQVTVVVGKIELVSGGPDAIFTNLTEQQSRV